MRQIVIQTFASLLEKATSWSATATFAAAGLPPVNSIPFGL